MKICMIQICSQLDPTSNMQKIEQWLSQAKTQHPDIKAVFLPEVFYSMSDGSKPTSFTVSENNEAMSEISHLAKKHSIFLLGGSVAFQKSDKVFNRTLNFNPNGELIGHYDKIHLFTLDLNTKDDKTILDERNLYQPGDKLAYFDIEDFKMGVTICFDLRFPEMFRKYYADGVNLFSISSAFTRPTGKAHWETLVRARAIENQSYVVACNQWGSHNEKMHSFGHSMIVDPWGEVLAQIKEEEGYAVAEISKDRIDEVRKRMDMTARIT